MGQFYDFEVVISKSWKQRMCISKRLGAEVRKRITGGIREHLLEVVTTVHGGTGDIQMNRRVGMGRMCFSHSEIESH